jgi:hypothetical protein
MWEGASNVWGSLNLTLLFQWGMKSVGNKKQTTMIPMGHNGRNHLTQADHE